VMQTGVSTIYLNIFLALWFVFGIFSALCMRGPPASHVIPSPPTTATTVRF
jgi:hypothetical protein